MPVTSNSGWRVLRRASATSFTLLKAPASRPPIVLEHDESRGLLATVAMTTILQGAQGMGLSRLSLPFLAGTFFTGNRRWAVIVGFVFYVIGGWLFVFLYFLLFDSRVLHFVAWRVGGLLHDSFCSRPGFRSCRLSIRGWLRKLPMARPPCATGFMGLNYDQPRTPVDHPLLGPSPIWSCSGVCRSCRNSTARLRAYSSADYHLPSLRIIRLCNPGAERNSDTAPARRSGSRST